MNVIYAEKLDMGSKIAAALGGIVLPSGVTVTLSTLPTHIKEVKKLQESQGYLDIQFKGVPTKVTWGFGHLYTLKDTFEYNSVYKKWADRPVCYIPEKYELRPVTHSEARFAERNDRQRGIVKDLFDRADLIINSTDDDREGEVIFAYVYEASKCKTPYVRVRFTSQTEKGIREAFDNLIPSSESKPIEDAGRARGIYDWLIGTNLTTRFTLKNPGNGVLSVGRVQTPVLKMIVDREKAISVFSSKKFWTLKGLFTTIGNEDYSGEHIKKRFDSRAEAEAILSKVNGHKGTVTSVEGKKSKKEVPLLFSQTVLQMEANDQFGYTPDKTLEISQWLYEQGYTTYPRTKSQYLNDDMRPVVIALLKKLAILPEYKKYIDGMPLTPQAFFFDSSKVDSHFAIIPTEKLPAKLTTEQQNIYDLIAKSVIRTIYPSAVIENITTITLVNGEEFISKGSVVVTPGWLLVDGKIKAEKLPPLKVRESVDTAFEVKEGKTEPPKRYTDKTILAAMKTAGKDLDDEALKKILADPSVEGIGTDATRAEILKTLATRGYITRKGKSIYATIKAIQFIDGFPVEDIKSPAFTAMMEQRLANIANKRELLSIFVRDVQAQTRNWCELIEKAPTTMGVTSSGSGGTATGPLTCPLCHKPIRRKSWGWGCIGYTEGCKFTLSEKICEKKLTDNQASDLLSKGRTRKISGFISKSGKKFDAVLYLDSDGKVKFEFK